MKEPAVLMAWVPSVHLAPLGHRIACQEKVRTTSPRYYKRDLEYSKAEESRAGISFPWCGYPDLKRFGGNKRKDF